MGSLTPPGFDVLVAFDPSNSLDPWLPWPRASEGSVIPVSDAGDYEEAVWRIGDKTPRYVLLVEVEYTEVPDDYAANFPHTPQRTLVFQSPEREWSYRWPLEGAWQEAPSAEARSSALAALKAFLADLRAPVTPAESADIELERVEVPDRPHLIELTRHAERILSVVEAYLESGAWNSDDGTEHDVAGLMTTLRNELYPPSGRNPLMSVLEGSLLQLMLYLLQAVRDAPDASANDIANTAWVTEHLVEPLASATESDSGVTEALHVARALGEKADWDTAANASRESETDEAAALQVLAGVDDADRPAMPEKIIFPGYDRGPIYVAFAEGIGTVRNFGAVGVILGAALGTAVGYGMGSAPLAAAVQGGGAIGGVTGGPIGIVIGATVAYLAARYRWGSSDGDSP